jgi:hypothetical protein
MTLFFPANGVLYFKEKEHTLSHSPWYKNSISSAPPPPNVAFQRSSILTFSLPLD